MKMKTCELQFHRKGDISSAPKREVMISRRLKTNPFQREMNIFSNSRDTNVHGDQMWGISF